MAVSCDLWVVLGPTASGKSALALALARRLKAHILCVDSMQVYRGMDVGTAKHSAAEQDQIPHHGIDLANPDETFTVARYVEHAQQTLADCAAQGVAVVAVGGTPLYYKALFEGLFQGPPADEQLRQRLRDSGGAALHQRLAQVDPQAAARIHANDLKRLVRALEVYELTGRPISSFHGDWGQLRYPARWLGLSWDRPALNSRINARVKAMIEAGWIPETESLLKRFGQLSSTAAEATGYRQLIQHLEGRLSLADAIEAIKIATRQLARRQIKWFRRFGQVRWIEGTLPLEQQLELALRAPLVEG